MASSVLHGVEPARGGLRLGLDRRPVREPELLLVQAARSSSGPRGRTGRCARRCSRARRRPPSRRSPVRRTFSRRRRGQEECAQRADHDAAGWSAPVLKVMMRVKVTTLSRARWSRISTRSTLGVFSSARLVAGDLARVVRLRLDLDRVLRGRRRPQELDRGRALRHRDLRARRPRSSRAAGGASSRGRRCAPRGPAPP